MTRSAIVLVTALLALVGYSDLTSILNSLAREGGAVQVHGPMAAAGLAREENARRLLAMMRGELCGRELFRFARRSVARHGVADAKEAECGFRIGA